MFVGHLAVAFGSTHLAPKVPLPWLVTGAMLVDLLWPILLLVGIERVRIAPGAMAFTPLVFEHYPWTHSLLMGVVLGVAFAGVARAAGVERSALLLLAVIVPSHWVLDLITHAPDLPLWPGASRGYGMRLWDSVPASFALEGALWVAAIIVYLKARPPRGAAGQFAFWSFVLFATASWASGPFGPPPPNERVLAYVALALWILPPWALWIERTSSGCGPLGNG